MGGIIEEYLKQRNESWYSITNWFYWFYNDGWSWWIGDKISTLFFSCSRKRSKARNSLLKGLNYHLYIISVCILLLAYEIKYFVYCWHFLLLYCLKLISYVWVSPHYLSGFGYQQFVLIIEGVLNSSALWVYILCVLDKGNHFNFINWAVYKGQK